MQNIITQLETSHLESKQNSCKQLNPKLEPMLKVKVFPFYMQVLQKIFIKKRKERKKDGMTVSMLQALMVMSDSTLIFPTIHQ
jgi:hypothetical protein